MNGGKKDFDDSQSSEDIEEFHDSESSEDIFDLFNFCDGILREDDLLDVSQLDKYDEQEKKEINVRRLKEIWAHTATGCDHCAAIVAMLSEMRGSLSEDYEESYDEPDVNVSNSIS